MIERRVIRAVVTVSMTGYFLDGATQRGITYDALQAFEKALNENLNTGHLKVHVAIIPVARDQLIPALLDGRADIAAANLTITPERQRLVDFSEAGWTGVSELVVTGPSAPPLSELHDLSGQEIHVRASSSYYESLQSLNEAVATMQELSSRLLPPSMGYEWTGVTYQQLVAGNQAPIIFGLAFVFVFLFLAAQYESWLIPFSVILTIPFSLLGAVVATWARALDNNVYTQIGLVLLIGLSAKTAILIVEFAKQLREEEGRDTLEAAVEAARLRFRPLLMTALSFILGVLPLLLASGAGAASRRALGTAVFGGMLLSTVMGVFLTPVFFVLVQKLRDRSMKAPAPVAASAGESS